jgi:hypothetical protein
VVASHWAANSAVSAHDSIQFDMPDRCYRKQSDFPFAISIIFVSTQAILLLMVMRSLLLDGPRSAFWQRR